MNEDTEQLKKGREVISKKRTASLQRTRELYNMYVAKAKARFPEIDFTGNRQRIPEVLVRGLIMTLLFENGCKKYHICTIMKQSNANVHLTIVRMEGNRKYHYKNHHDIIDFMESLSKYQPEPKLDDLSVRLHADIAKMSQEQKSDLQEFIDDYIELN